MNVFVVTPPLVQLNSPYPSGAYLKVFFIKQGHTSIWEDLSLELFHSIFSSNGLKKLFDLSSKKAAKLVIDAQNSGDDGTAFNLRRYLSLSDNWINWIDWIVAILCDGSKAFSGREKAHEFLYSPYAPRGNRMESFLSSLEHEPSVDDVRYLCTLALADLADYITIAFDSNFSLIRYAESLTVDQRSFAEIEKNLDSPVLKNFYTPVLENFYEKYKEKLEYSRVCISIPFAGTFVPALYTARFLKNKLGNKVYVCIGGGFVNTELRDAKDSSLKKYIDAISYDRGYGSYLALDETGDERKQIYKLRQFYNDEILEPEWSNSKYESFETEITAEIIPDYSDIDFSRYPRVCDDKNPMHRLWTDGAWIKAYLAHGCYWHKCAFCDTQLDYVCGYKPVNIKNLYNGLSDTAIKKGVYGIHFVDEALPPKMLREFALLNCATKNKRLYYWGNVRFEKSFSKDLASFLAYGGLGGVSAGLEVATGEGLENINKGTDIESIVNACAAFKEAGILVHAYMIYGFWNDTPQSIVNSMETLRQFFEAGLLDSAFWHKFVLTRNSTVYTDWKKGLHPELKPIEVSSKKAKDSGNIFANNNLHFEGENKYDKFGLALDSAVNSWMHGDKLQMKVQKWFDFQVPAPTIPHDYVEKLIEKYEKKCNQYYQKCPVNENQTGEQLYWLGGKVLMFGSSITWIYLQEEFVITEQKLRNRLLDFTNYLYNLRPEAASEERTEALKIFASDKDFYQLLKKIRGKGLVLV